jgi:hypothetical protein
MAQLDTLLLALTQGHSVRRDEWEPIIRMFVLNDTLMCQCGNSKPWNHSLTWGEITASDWQLIDVQSVVEQEQKTSLSLTPIPCEPPVASRNPFRRSGPLYKSMPFGLFLKWWNA